MSETPKKGDKVTAITNRQRPQDRREYTLDEALSAKPHPHEIVRVRVEAGHTTHVWADSVQPAGPQVGDRVRLVYKAEGEIVDVVDDGFTFKDSSATDPDETWDFTDTERVTVEILERKSEQYVRGTVAIWAGSLTALPLIRGNDGAWRNHAGEVAGGVTDKRVRTSGEYEIIHAPADRG